MRFMMIVKSDQTCDREGPPQDERALKAMDKYNEALIKAGALVELSGLQPSSKGARVKFSKGIVTVTDGPFPETKELIGGYWIIDVKSKEEALEWAKRAPMPETNREVEIELRQIHDVGEFAPRRILEKSAKSAKKLAAKKS
jgi:hypothetical protein